MEEGVDGTGPLQGGPDGTGNHLVLHVTMMDGVGCGAKFKDSGVFEECLVIHEIIMWHEKGSE